jgi:uncharacterized protein YbjT (DUF2867 family)
MKASSTLIIGGTGKVGRELVRLFFVNNQPVRVLTRNLMKATIDVRHTQYIFGKLEDFRPVSLALEGVKQVFLLTGDHPEQAAREKAFIDLALGHGVERIVKLSAFVAGLEPPVSFGRQLHLVEKKLLASPLGWTILRPHMFMQNFLDLKGLIARRGLLPSPFGKGKVSFIDTRDIAAVAFKILTEGGHEQQIYELSGPDAISFPQAAAEISAAIGKKVRYLPLPELLARPALRGQGFSRWHVEMILELSRVIKENKQAHVVSAVEQITGQKPRTFRDFLLDHQHKFLA